MRLDNVVDVTENLYPVEGEYHEEFGVQEGSHVKPLKSPSAPSRQEMLEHSITHYTFRSWCVHCTMGKCKASQHKISGASEASEVPIVGFDDAFLSDRGSKSEEDTEDVDDTTLKMLVAHDSKSKVCPAIPVPQQGVDLEDWPVRESLNFFECLGYQKVVFKTDQEEALNALLNVFI